MRIALIGTRGVPAKYGGFETAVEEVGSRLVQMGHEVVVYCRGEDRSVEYLGMQRVCLPSVQHPVAETLSHTGLSVLHMLARRPDVAIVFNAANAPVLPIIRAAGVPVAVHVDGLEWMRGKWGPLGARYYLANERLSVRLADELISDAEGIADYYRKRYMATSVVIPYGAPIVREYNLRKLESVGLTPDGFHLAVARIEPENHLDVIIDGYRRSSAAKQLVVVGSVPYPSEYESRVRSMAEADSRIRLLGGVWDQELLDSLYAASVSYLHGHSVGGTNPSLLRAMGAGSNIAAWDVNFNREVLGVTGRFFEDSGTVEALVEASENDPLLSQEFGVQAQVRAAEKYKWSDVAEAYQELCFDLSSRSRARSLRS